MENNKKEVVLTEMQKKVGVRDIVLVRNNDNEIGNPYLITFADPGDNFMTAIRILPSFRRNDLTISASHFNNPKTSEFKGGGYVNVFTGINTIRRVNVTTWLSNLDNDVYLRIIYGMFCGMLGYYTTNGKSRLPAQIPLQFSVNVNLMGALKSSGIRQKSGEAIQFDAPPKKYDNDESKKPDNEGLKTGQNNTKQDAATKTETEENEDEEDTSGSVTDGGWRSPNGIKTVDPAVMDVIFDGWDSNADFQFPEIIITDEFLKKFGLDIANYKYMDKIKKTKISDIEFSSCIMYGENRSSVGYINTDEIIYYSGFPYEIGMDFADDLEHEIIRACNDIYAKACEMISKMNKK